jgi:hypothetical protein
MSILLGFQITTTAPEMLVVKCVRQLIAPRFSLVTEGRWSNAFRDFLIYIYVLVALNHPRFQHLEKYSTGMAIEFEFAEE